MKLNNRSVFIIDDDVEICGALRWLFESVNYQVHTYCSAKLFLDAYDCNMQGCIILDVRLPMMSGLELLEQLKQRNNHLPVIMITGYGDIPMAIRAMKAGAVDFILKPFNEQCLLDIVQKNLLFPVSDTLTQEVHERARLLSDRERQVMGLLLDGRLNKEIAYELCISISTVEAHRANIMRKMKAKNLAQLIKFYLQTQVDSIQYA